MARTDTGKWVARAAATGGGRTYRGQRPTKWYASLVLLVLVGVFLVWYSRYERQNPPSAGHPTLSDHWHEAYAFDICGVIEPNLPQNPNLNASPAPGIHTHGDGLIHVEPNGNKDTGANATLGRFIQLYPGAKLTSTSVRVPGARSTTVGRLFTNNDKCPAGTPDAGKRGIVQVKVWPDQAGTTAQVGKAKPYIAGDPDGVRLQNGQLITIAFVPKGAKIPEPVDNIATLLQTMSAGLANGQHVPAGGITATTTVPSTPGSTPTSAP